MARIFMAGFETGSTAQAPYVVNNGVAASTVQARTGTYSLLVAAESQYIDYSLGSGADELYMRIGTFPYGGSNVRQLFALKNADDDVHLTFSWNSSGNIEVRRGTYSGTLLATGTATLNASTWYCVEVYALIADSDGAVQVKVDGVSDIDYSGDTLNSGSEVVTKLRIGTGGFNNCARQYVDDLAVNDTTGSINNSWVGRGGIYGLVPSGAGTHTDFTPSTGDNYAAVDEVPPDDDTSYVESSTAAHVDTYAITNLTPTSGTVLAVQWVARAKLAEAGSGNFQRVLRHDSTDYNGGDLAADTSYAYFSEIFQQAPDSTDWDITKVNALEAGMEIS